MKKFWKITACILLAVMLALGALVYAANEYSPEDDPLISLSYVNKVLLPQIKSMIEDMLGGVDIGDIVITTAPETTEVPETTAPEPEVVYPEGTVHTGAQYAVINLQEGETLFASVTSCEVIVRSGSTKVVSPFTVKWEEQGVSDTTDGKEIYHDEAVPTNHTIIIPRDDGRGITVGAGGAWLMVRGDYIVKTVEAAAETTEVPAETTGVIE